MLCLCAVCGSLLASRISKLPFQTASNVVLGRICRPHNARLLMVSAMFAFPLTQKCLPTCTLSIARLSVTSKNWAHHSSGSHQSAHSPSLSPCHLSLFSLQFSVRQVAELYSQRDNIDTLTIVRPSVIGMCTEVFEWLQYRLHDFKKTVRQEQIDAGMSRLVAIIVEALSGSYLALCWFV